MRESQSSKTASILMIDDSAEEFVAVCRAFKKVGLSNAIEYATSGEEALEYLRSENKNRPCLILLDINMPGIGGHMTLKLIKQDNDLKEIPVIMFSSSDKKSDIKTCYRFGANSYFLKQSDFNLLVTSMKVLKEYWLDTAMLP